MHCMCNTNLYNMTFSSGYMHILNAWPLNISTRHSQLVEHSYKPVDTPTFYLLCDVHSPLSADTHPTTELIVVTS